MERFCGTIGYVKTVETAPGVWEEVVTERKYRGDVIRDTRALQQGFGTNDDISINNSFSIVSDAYADQNFYAIRYLDWKGNRWKVTSAEVQHPRLILTIGGLYNGKNSN